jgi:plasmid stabilization system protein ParE
MPVTSAYRDHDVALAARRDVLVRRVAELEADLAASPGGRRLPRALRQRLDELRERAGTRGSVHDVVAAERATDHLEATLDEELGLGAELGKSVDSLLPSIATLVHWSRYAVLSVVMLGAVVHQLNLADFMWRALGAKVERARPDLAMSYQVRDAVTQLGGSPTADFGPPPRLEDEQALSCQQR